MRVSLLLLITVPLLLTASEVAVLILARGGSKGVRLKNLQPVGGVSLVARAVHTAKIAGATDVTVSTDHPLIALEALKNGAQVYRRSKVAASDWAPSIWGAAEFVASRPRVQVLVLLQATSPFIPSEQLRNALNEIKRRDCVFSVTRSYKLRWQKNKDVVNPLNFKLNARPRRQDWDGELLETGAFYISRRHLIENGYFQNNQCGVIELSAIESLEVDSVHDLGVANALLRANLV